MNALIKMVQSMLNDDHGVSEQTYMSLLEMFNTVDADTQAELMAIFRRVDATDGRFYLPID